MKILKEKIINQFLKKEENKKKKNKTKSKDKNKKNIKRTDGFSDRINSELRKPRNPFHRMHLPNKAAHLLLTQTADGIVEGTQFPVNGSEFYRPLSIPSTPSTREIHQKELSEMFLSPSDTNFREKFPLRAYTPKGTELTTARSVKIEVVEVATSNTASAAGSCTTTPEKTASEKTKSLLLLFSEDRSSVDQDRPNLPRGKKKRKIRSITQELNEAAKMNPRATADTSESPESPKPDGTDSSETAIKADYEKENIQGGIPITLNPCKRNRKASQQQNTVKGKSSKDEVIEFITNHPDFNTDTLQTLKLLVDKYALEWLHRLSFALCPEEYEPQDKNNLSAGPKWINTFMMVLEEVAGFYNKKSASATSTTSVPTKPLVIVTPTFRNLPQSDIIEEIYYQVSIQLNNKTIILSNRVKAISTPNRSNWPSASDAAQTKAVVEALFTDKKPNVRQAFG